MMPRLGRVVFPAPRENTGYRLAMPSLHLPGSRREPRFFAPPKRTWFYLPGVSPCLSTRPGTRLWSFSNVNVSSNAGRKSG